MRQFKQLGWIPQALLSLVLLSAMSQSNAMSVRERYLQEHPAAKTESSPEKSSHHQKHHVSEKHTVKVPVKHHTVQKQEHHHAVKTHTKATHVKAEHIKHHAKEKPVQKAEVSPRVVTPKLTPSKFDSQQARDAELALQHQPVKKEVVAQPTHVKHHRATTHVATTKHHVAKHHAVKPVQKYLHKHHRAD